MLQWTAGAAWTRAGGWVRSIDDAKHFDRLLARLRAFGFERFHIDVQPTPAVWTLPGEIAREIADARAYAQGRGFSVSVRTQEEVPFSLEKGVDLRGLGRYWTERLPGGAGDPVYLFLDAKSILIPKEELEDLVRAVPPGAAQVAFRAGFPWEAAQARRRASFRPLAEDGAFPETLLRTVVPRSLAMWNRGPFDVTRATADVVDALAASGPPESWTIDLLEDLHRRDPAPFQRVFTHVGVEVTNEDDLPNRLRAPARVSKRPPGRMSEEDWERLLGGCPVDLAPVSMDLWDFGEPLLHPRLAGWVEAAARSGLRVDLYTNGLRLEGETAERLAAGGLDALFVRLDAATPAGWASVSGDSAEGYGRVVRNLADFARLRAARFSGAPPPWKPAIAVQCTEMPQTAAEADAFLAAFDGAGRIRERIRKETGRDAAPTAVLSELYASDAPYDYAMIRHDNLFRGKVRREGGADFTPLRRFPCRQANEGPYVLWNGDVVACREDVDGEAPVGHVRDGLLAVWRGPALSELRARHAGGGWDDLPFCKPCKEWYYPFA